MSDAARESDSLPSKRRGFRLWHLMAIGFGLLLLSLLLMLGWLVRRNVSANSKVANTIQGLQRDGLPYDDSSLTRYYAQLTSNSKVDAWQKLLEDLRSPAFEKACMAHYPWSTEEDPSANGSIPWPEEQAAVEFLNQWTDLRRLAHDLAIQDVKVRFPIKFNGVKTDIGVSSELRKLARLFQLESQLAIRARNSSATCESILCLLGTARSIEGQPLIVSQLVCMAIEGVALGQIRKAAEQNVLNERDLKLILDRLQSRTSFGTRWKIAIHGDRAITLPAFHDPRGQIGDEGGGGWILAVPFQASGEAAYLELSQRATEMVTEDVTEFLESAQALELEVQRRAQNSSLLARLDHVVLNLVTPAYSSVAEAFLNSEVHSRLAIVALSLRLYQKKHQQFPTSLDQLSELGMALDQLKPIGGRPFGYRLVDGQVTLWGFSRRTAAITPSEPPQITPENRINEAWVWELR